MKSNFPPSNFLLLFSITISLIGIVAFSGCESKQPVKIGFVTGTSGRVADLGISGLDAVQLIIEECNRNGGINGRPVQLLIRDDRQDPAAARQAVQELLRENVAAIIGPMTSDMAMAVVPLLNEARVLAVSPTATTEALSGQDDYFFRVCSTTRENAILNARYQIKSGNMRHITAAYDTGNRSFSEKWFENFKNAFTAEGGAVMTAIGFNTKDGQSFSTITEKLLAPKPDGVLIVANSMDSALLCQQIRKVAGDISIVLSDWGATERLLELGGKAVEGVTVVQTFNRESPEPDYQAFRKKYIDRYRREPGFPGVNAYNAAYVVLTALTLQKEAQSLKDTLLAIRQFNCLQKDLRFDNNGDASRPNAFMGIVRNRKFVVVE